MKLVLRWVLFVLPVTFRLACYGACFYVAWHYFFAYPAYIADYARATHIPHESLAWTLIPEWEILHGAAIWVLLIVGGSVSVLIRGEQ